MGYIREQSFKYLRGGGYLIFLGGVSNLFRTGQMRECFQTLKGDWFFPCLTGKHFLINVMKNICFQENQLNLGIYKIWAWRGVDMFFTRLERGGGNLLPPNLNFVPFMHMSKWLRVKGEQAHGRSLSAHTGDR